MLCIALRRAKQKQIKRAKQYSFALFAFFKCLWSLSVPEPILNEYTKVRKIDDSVNG